VSGQLHNPAVLTTRKQDPVSIEYEVLWAQGQVLTLQRETLSSLPGIEPRFIDHAASSLVPYPLNCPPSRIFLNISKTNRTINCVSISLDSDKKRKFRDRHRRNPALHFKAEIASLTIQSGRFCHIYFLRGYSFMTFDLTCHFASCHALSGTIEMSTNTKLKLLFLIGNELLIFDICERLISR
jgi:hypothetical protein